MRRLLSLSVPHSRRPVPRRAGLSAVALCCIVAIGAASCGSGAPRAPAAAVGMPDSVVAPPGYRVPPDSLIPTGALGASIRRGRAIVVATRDSLPGHVSNRLACTNCHRDAGTRAGSGPWVGAFASFPQYNARAGRVIRIEDRVNECLRRSLTACHSRSTAAI